jgi:hypothetical protein
VRNSSGAPTQVNPAVYADFDAALQLAAKYDLYYDFVLFSAPTAIPQSWSTDPGQRAQLATALGTLFAHYKGNPHVLSWEVFNEPEFDVNSGKIDAGSVQATIRAIADSVHSNSTAYVTVGNAFLSGLPLVVGQHLDYYEAHWYDPMSGADCARCTDYATVQNTYHLDAPLVIGELYAPPNLDAPQRLSDLYAAGYAGAWPWSLFPDHTSDKFAVDPSATQALSQQHVDTGPSVTPVPPGATAIPAATATPTAITVPTPAPTVVGPSFLSGFTQLKGSLGDVMGDPIENEHTMPDSCDTQQHTTTGLAYWRCSTNTPSFVAYPDGVRHWALVAGQVVQWVGPSEDPPSASAG